MTRSLRFGLLAATALSTPALAQDGYDLGTLILGGGLTPIEAENYGRSVSVLTAAVIEERGIATVGQALRALPGVSVTNTGPSYGVVRIRGGEANHAIILIDGVQIGDSSGGDTVLRGLSLANVERIEVLRGPQSALYGSNAMTGVISITTREARAEGTSYGGGLEFGSNGTVNSNLYVTQSGERGEISLSVDSYKTDGEDGSRLNGGDTESTDAKTVTLKGEYDLTETLTAGFSFRRASTDYGYEDPIPWGATTPTPAGYLRESPVNGTQIETLGSVWMQMGGEDETMSHRLTFTANEFETKTRGSLSAFGCCGYTEGSNRTFKYLGSFALDGAALGDSAHRLNLLAETREDTFDASYTGAGIYSRDSQSIGVEYLGTYDNGLALQLGARHDFNSVFQDSTTWNASLSYNLPGCDIRLRGAIGTAVVNPTMTEQFGFVPGTYIGNPNLRPEESRPIEIGADFGLGGRGTFSVSAFGSEVTDLIAGSGATSTNLTGTSTIKGFEMAVDYEVTAGLTLLGTYTRLDAKDSTGNPLRRRPEHELTLGLSADTFGGRGTVDLGLRHVSGNYANQFFAAGTPTVELPDFTTVDLAMTYDINDMFTLTGRVTNLTDEDYQEAWGYYANGREIFVGLSADF